MMPRAVPQPVREQIVSRRKAGESLTEIAATLRLPYRSVRGLWSRFRSRGEAGLTPSYDRCAKFGPHFPAAVYEAALAMKREHPRWGAGMVLVQLGQLFAQEPLPKRRTVQEWFQKAGLSPGRSRSPAVNHQRGKQAHEVWQLDAKEEIRLGDGSVSVSLSMMDEATGAVLGVALFPPREVCGPPRREGESLVGPSLLRLGDAPAAAGRQWLALG
jgi:hypothetical protein